MDIFVGPRQSGKTELLLRKAMKHGVATIIEPTHVEVNLLKDELKRRNCHLDIKVITFVEFCTNRGSAYPNVYIDDIDRCIQSMNHIHGNRTNIIAGTMLSDTATLVCDELENEK